jgi:hypothetical protein
LRQQRERASARSPALPGTQRAERDRREHSALWRLGRRRRSSSPRPSNAGGAATQTANLTRLGVIAPKTFRAGRRYMLFGLTTQAKDVLRVALQNGPKAIASRRATIGKSGGKLSMPKRRAAGRYARARRALSP